MSPKPILTELERFPRPSLAVDVVVLTVEGGELHVLLYRREAEPQRGRHALPGGFMHIEESIDGAVTRLMKQKIGLAGCFVEQLYTFGGLDRDPRGRVVTVAYYALVDARRFRDHTVATALSARVVIPWRGETGGPVKVVGTDGKTLSLFLDHATILGAAVKRLRAQLDTSPIGFQLLPQQFTLRALQDVHETVRGEAFNKDSFRRRMLASGLLEATGEQERAVLHRPAELYRFTRRSAT